jgi:ribonuclease HII
MATLKVSHDFARNFYEKMIWHEQKLVVGIDEVGRGSLAGPVVAAAAVLKTQKAPKIITDSKLLSAEERAHAYEWLIEHSYWSIGIVHHREVDSKNIYQATLRAMRRAYEQLLIKLPQDPGAVLIDAMPLLLPYDLPVYAFCFGETRSVSIAAASIIAKVTRDRLMESYDLKFPGYGFAAHKGYGTAQHQEELRKRGISPIHRVSFVESAPTEKSAQQPLFGKL